MLIQIKEDLFEGENFKGLNYLIQIASYKQRYELFVDLTLVQNCELYIKLDQADKEVLEQDFNRFVQEAAVPQYEITEVVSHQKSLSVDEAVRFLNQPFIILLENSNNDSHFMKAIIYHFGEHKIKIHLENNWIKFGNMGGGENLRNVLTGIKNDFENLPKKSESYLRCFAVLDSDKSYENMPIKPDKEKSLVFLNTHNVPFHVLEKREMENYLPDEVIASVEDNFIELYLALSPFQKDYFDLQFGFNKNRTDKNYDQRILDFYKTVSNEDWKILKNGISTDVYKKSFKTEFPKLFNHELVTRDTLLSRCSHHEGDPNELFNLVSEITNLL